MRFAPPKSAPPDRRSCIKETSEREYGKPILSGWISPRETSAQDLTNVHDDVTLLKECAAASKRRCRDYLAYRIHREHSFHLRTAYGGSVLSSDSPITSLATLTRLSGSAAIQRQKFSHSVFIQLEKLGRLSVSKSESNLSAKKEIKENGSCTQSKDSGVSELVSTASMDRFKLEDDEFSDLSDSDDSSIKEELQISWSSKTSLLEDNEAVEGARTELKQYLDKLSKFKDLSIGDGKESEYKKGIIQRSSNNTERSLNTRPRSPNTRQRSLTPDNRQSASFHREHTIPHSFTTELPDRPTQTQLWSKRQKERIQNNKGATSPLLCNSQQQVGRVDNKVNKHSKHFPGSLLQLNNTAQNNVKINLESVMGSLYSRPPYRNEKRRGSTISKSSASIPSLSTPCQALLLVGVQPTKPIGTTKQLKRAHRTSGAFKPSIPTTQTPAKYVQDEQNIVELPALMVNGAGDLVIRKKQIMPT